MAKKKNAKRTEQHPFVPPTKNKKPKGTSPYAVARRARIQAITARTKGARLELDDRAAGADLSDLEAHPHVFYPLGVAPKPPGLKRVGFYDEDDEEIPPPIIERPPIAPPVVFDKREDLVTQSVQATVVRRRNFCGECGEPGHNRGSCPDLITTERWSEIDRVVAASVSIRQASITLGMSNGYLKKVLDARLKLQRARAARRAAGQPVAL